jgi:Ser/Thr protein kinase RdoA (MazF antagonist)
MRLAAEAAREAGLPAAAVELVRDGSNVVVRLGDGVVGRIGERRSLKQAAYTVRVACWLRSEGIATVEPLGDVPQPSVVRGRPVTWWRELPPHRPATPAELGAVLRTIHRLPLPATLALRPLDPFVHLDDRIGNAGWIQADDRAWLQQHLDGLRAEWASRSPGIQPAVIHGDAWQGNVAVPDSGDPILLDLDRVGIGPRDWDLIPVAVDRVDFARIGEGEYQSFVDAYGGYDVTASSAFRMLADIAELRWVCFVAKRGRSDQAAADEACHRISCLRGRVPRPWRWTAF